MIDMSEDNKVTYVRSTKCKSPMTYNSAIKMLEKEYDKAKSLDFVRDPLAYALYQVWKEADRRGRMLK